MNEQWKLVVSFLNLTACITNGEIFKKMLKSEGDHSDQEEDVAKNRHCRRDAILQCEGNGTMCNHCCIPQNVSLSRDFNMSMWSMCNGCETANG